MSAQGTHVSSGHAHPGEKYRTRQQMEKAQSAPCRARILKISFPDIFQPEKNPDFRPHPLTDAIPACQRRQPGWLHLPAQNVD